MIFFNNVAFFLSSLIHIKENVFNFNKYFIFISFFKISMFYCIDFYLTQKKTPNILLYIINFFKTIEYLLLCRFVAGGYYCVFVQDLKDCNLICFVCMLLLQHIHLKCKKLILYNFLILLSFLYFLYLSSLKLNINENIF